MKRTRMLSILLAVLLVFSCSAAVLAAEPMTVTVETKADAVSVGEEVSLTVSIAGNPGFTNYEWAVEYDTASLELKKVENKLSAYLATREEEGRVNLALMSAEPISENGTAFVVTFLVKEKAAAGLSEVKLSSKKLANLSQTLQAQYIAGGVTIASATGGSTTGGSTTGGSTTGGSTTGGSTTGGSTTGGSTTGGSTTGGSTTGGSTTGGSTTGGSTTGGSTTGGSTTGGSTTGGSTTGGSTTGGSTTGGSTTGGSTTGGSTTGGSTTGGSTTGGSTTGGSTTGGSTTGGSTTGGSTTGGSTTGGSTTGAVKVTDIAVGVEKYTVIGRTVTVTSQNACKLGYLEGGKYVAITPTDNGDGSYSFEVPEGITDVVLVIKGDINGDGEIKGSDITQLKAGCLGKLKTPLTELQIFAGDIVSDGEIKGSDITQLKAAFLGKIELSW